MRVVLRPRRTLPGRAALDDRAALVGPAALGGRDPACCQAADIESPSRRWVHRSAAKVARGEPPQDTATQPARRSSRRGSR